MKRKIVKVGQIPVILTSDIVDIVEYTMSDKDHALYNSPEMRYLYLNCVERSYDRVIHPNIELKNIHLLNDIMKHFRRVVNDVMEIKKGYKSVERKIDSMFSRWYFSQFVNDRCERNYYIPYNPTNFQTLREDVLYNYGEKKPLLTKSLIKQLNMTEMCNEAVHEVEAYTNSGKYNAKYKITKQFTKRNVSLTMNIFKTFIPGNIRTVHISKQVYNKLKRSFDSIYEAHYHDKHKTHSHDKRYDINDSLSQPQKFDVIVWSLISRYVSLKIYNQQLAVHPKIYKSLQHKFGLQFETFASGLNKVFTNYCSLFYDLEVYFGSRGSFFGLYPENGFYSVNPPFDTVIIDLTIDRVMMALKDNELSEDSLGFFITIPVWDVESLMYLKEKGKHNIAISKDIPPFPVVDVMKKSKFLKYHRVLGNNEFLYHDYTSNRNKYINTHVFILGNNSFLIDKAHVNRALNV